MSELLDLVTDVEARPEGLLEGHRFDWPFNITTVGMTPGKGSTRTRMKRALTEMEKQGLTATGPCKHDEDPPAYRSDVILWAEFARGGELRGYARAECAPDLRSQVQALLNAEAIPAVVSFQGEVLIAPQAPADEQALLSIEVGCQSSLRDDDLYSALQWVQDGTDPSEILRRLADGWTAASLAPWIDKGFTAAAAQIWSKHGFAPTPASLWSNAKISAYMAQRWIDCGFSAADATEFLGYYDGYLDPRAAREMIDAGCSRPEVAAWVSFLGGFATLAERAKWRARGMTATRLQDLVKCGYGYEYGNHQCREWLAKWLDGKSRPEAELWEWALLGPEVLRSGEVKAWEKLGADPSAVREWQRAFGRNDLRAAEARQVIATGIAPSELHRWTEQDVELGKELRFLGWAEAGMTPEQAGSWARVGEGSSDYRWAKEWIENGLTPSQAQEWSALHPRFADPMVVRSLAEKGMTIEMARQMLNAIKDPS